MTFIQKLNRLPPCLCRLIATDPNNRKRRLSSDEIAARCGMSKWTVMRISKMKSWDKLAVHKIDRFASGCGIDLLRQARHIAALKRQLKNPNGYRLYKNRARKRWPTKRILQLIGANIS